MWSNIIQDVSYHKRIKRINKEHHDRDVSSFYFIEEENIE